MDKRAWRIRSARCVPLLCSALLFWATISFNAAVSAPMTAIAVGPSAHVTAAYRYGHYDYNAAHIPLNFNCGADKLCDESLGNGNMRYYDYTTDRSNPYGEVRRVRLQDGAGRFLAELDYRYDLHGDVLSETLRDEHDGIERQSYRYDAARRLIRVERTSYEHGVWSLPVTVSFAYDGNDNIAHVERQPGAPQDFRYDGLDKLQGCRYDARGNMITDGHGKVYVYDDNVRLMIAKTESGVYRYDYNPAGLRTGKWQKDNKNKERTLHYYYRGAELSNAENGDGDVSYYLDRVGRLLTGAHGTLVSAGSHYYFANFQGSVVGKTSANNGDVRQKKSYTPYGDTRHDTSGIGTSCQVFDLSQDVFGFDKEMRDAETGNVYLRARLYDPAMRRFLQPDSEQFMNRYAFADGNPVMAVDPSGHAPEVVSETKFPVKILQNAAGLLPFLINTLNVPGIGLLAAMFLGGTSYAASYAVENYQNVDAEPFFAGSLIFAFMIGTFPGGMGAVVAHHSAASISLRRMVGMQFAYGAFNAGLSTATNRHRTLLDYEETSDRQDVKHAAGRIAISALIGGILSAGFGAVFRYQRSKTVDTWFRRKATDPGPLTRQTSVSQSLSDSLDDSLSAGGSKSNFSGAVGSAFRFPDPDQTKSLTGSMSLSSVLAEYNVVDINKTIPVPRPAYRITLLPQSYYSAELSHKITAPFKFVYGLFRGGRAG